MTVTRRLLVPAAAALALGTGVAPVPAPAAPTGGYDLVKLVSDRPGAARVTDPALVNPWGLALGPNTALWAADNGTDVSTVYTGHTPAPAGLAVTVPGGAPTGVVLQSTRNFAVRVPGGTAPAFALFAGETGHVSGWPSSASSSAAVDAVVDADAVYKGLAIVAPRGQVMLAAPDFHGGHVDLYDTHFRPVPRQGRFTDTGLPAGYAPFNVYDAGDLVYVAYAKQDAARHDEVAGRGNGFVDAYSADGRRLHRLVRRGPLDAPWGMTVAPAGFGRFSGALLVGNFGDGRINAFDRRSGAFLGSLRDERGRILRIDGLWALQPGTASTGGTRSVLFSAGPAGESHGLLGLLRAS
ncbi:MAG TPA: TIGR03118 family protein [Mycobacteriales bacterium]|jgi:uncharacterized protein (TIGR03118 family)